jgi:hypothetical protein
MTADSFRRLALGFPGAEEGSHMEGGLGMVKLTPEEQQNYLTASPEVFTPASGAWGRQGCTMVRLAAAKAPLVKQALATAAAGVRERTARPTGGRKSSKK